MNTHLLFRLTLSLVIVLSSLSPVFSQPGAASESSPVVKAQQSLVQDDAPQTAGPLVRAASAASTKSLNLDGTGDYVQIPHDPALGLDGASAITIEAWVRRADDSRCETIISKDYQSSYWLGFCNDVIRFYSGGELSSDGNTAILTDVWTHIAVVWESGGQRKYYVNGELDYTGSAGVGPAANAYSVFIGADPGPDADPYTFSGNIAEVRLWNVARGQDDIRRTMHVTLDEARPGLVSTWRLGDDFDDSIGSHHGAAVGNANLATTDPAVSLQPARVPVDSTFNTLAATRSGAATAYVPNLERVLLIGGTKGGSYSDNVDALDASTGNVSPLATLPTPLARSAAVYAPGNDTVYLFGGWSSALGAATDSIYALDPLSGTLRTLSVTVPVSVEDAAAVYHAGLDKVYILGGEDSGGAVADVSAFDPATETITPTNFSLPSGRYAMAAAYSPASDKIYYFGGSQVSATDTIFEIALDENGLDGTVSELTATLPISSYALTAIQDPTTQLIYLLGGLDQERVLAFDPLTGQLWQTPIELEQQRIRPSTIYNPRNRQALLVGGYYAGNKSNVWRIPLGDGPATSLGRWDFPTPVGAEAQSIDGDETRVLVGTTSDGAWRYEDDGSRYHYTAGILGSVSGSVRDVRYNALNDHSWLATADAGGQVDVDGSITVYDNTVLGTDDVRAVYVDPGYTSLNAAPSFGTLSEGLVRRTFQFFPLPGQWIWTTSFAGETVKAIARRDAEDIWVISHERLYQLIFNSLDETDYSAFQCGMTPLDDLTFGLNGDWWIVSSRTGEFDKPGVCRILAADIPGTDNYLEPSIGLVATGVDVDSDGRVWVSVESDFGESGGLVAYQVVGAAPGTLYTGEYNWLNAPLGGLDLWSSGTWGQGVESGFTAVGAADERVWAGKNDGRLVTLAQRWQQVDESNDMDQKVIEGIWTERGRAFMATSDSLHVLMPDGHTWDNRNGVKVWDVLGDSQGRTWVGTNTGIRLYTRDGWDYLPTAEGARPATAIYALAEDQAGRVWMGGLHGLTLFDRDRFVFTLTDANSDLPDEKIRALLTDRDDRLWIGTDVGLARLDGSDWTVFSTTHGLPSNAIFDLAQTGAGEIAVSTSGGLAFYDGGSFITETLLLPDANLPLTVDEIGRLWAGSAVRSASGWQGYYWTNSGLRSSEISDNAADGAERVWFSHAPDTGVSVRGSTLPPLPDVIPTLTGISPDHGSAGQTITITGSGFGSRIADLDVTVGHAPADIISLSDTEMQVRLNDHNRSGDVSVNLGGRRASLEDAFCGDPVLTSFDPTGGNDGVTVHVRGSNLDPGAQVSLGGGAPRVPGFSDATHLWLDIRPEDGTGPVQVTNECGLPHTASSSVEFRRITFNLERIVLNQGIMGTGLVADRTTMVQHYVSQSVARRGTDQLEIDTIELTFTEDGSAPRTYTIPYNDVIPNLVGPPGGTALVDINMSVNASVRPQIEGSIDQDDEVQVSAVLKYRGRTVAQGSTAAWFRPNYSMRVLLVPIMKNDYVYADVIELKNNVNVGLNHLRDRIMPTGRVEVYWSPQIYTVDDVLLGDSSTIDLGDTIQLYDASHDIDQARRWWNSHRDPDVLIAFGVVDDRALSSTDTSGKAFWPDMSQILNLLALDVIDGLCDIGNALLQVFSFGLLGSDDGCHLEIPLYVGWARGTATSGSTTQYSNLFGHEFGHIMGLVKPTASNGAWTDNFSHSVNDELDNGECGDGGATFNWNKSLYAQPGVSEPVVDPFRMEQFLPMNDGNAGTERGKAIMSYACTDNDNNVFFEPADVPFVFFEYAVSSGRNFVENLMPGGGRAARATSSVSQVNDVPLPLPVSGERLYVSGAITKTGDSGRLQHVEVLDEQAPLDAGYASGYWLVQLDGDGGELSRLGVFPVFTTANYGSSRADHASESDSGFFAATIQRQDGVARIELRHDDTLLDAIEAGGAAPSVSVSSPAGGVYDGGTINVAWTASDSDGDPLDIIILYSADGALSWTPVAFSSGSGSGSVEVEVRQLAGSSDARFQVMASDGFNTGSATSAAFTVTDQPPWPYVGSPISATILLEGDTVILSGGADDNQDGSVAAEGLHWRSDRDGELGSGAELPVLLSMGTHVLTLEAQNSVGLTATVTATVTIEGDYDYDGIGDSEELADGLNPLTEMDAYSDADGDGLPLITERERGLDPDNSDSDGDGRSDGEEIVDGTDPSTDDEPLSPDALAASPDDLTFEADLSLGTPLPQQLIQVSSRSPATWTLTADVDWLAASAASGQTPAGLTLMVNAYRLDDGLHTAYLTFDGIDAEGGAITPATVTVTVNISNSLAHFDVNLDGYVNVLDVQEVEDRVGSDNSQEDFSYHHDVDRDGDVDATDVQLIWDAVFRKIYLPIIMR